MIWFKKNTHVIGHKNYSLPMVPWNFWKESLESFEPINWRNHFRRPDSFPKDVIPNSTILKSYTPQKTESNQQLS